MNFDAETAVVGLIGSTVFLGVAGLFGCAAGLLVYGVNGLIVNNNFEKAQVFLEEQRMNLGSTIAEKTKISNFNVASLQLAEQNEEYILKAFGCTNIEKNNGSEENNYLNIYFNISQDEAQKIIKAIKNANIKKVIKQSNSIDYINTIRDVDCWEITESDSIKKATEACFEVYDLMQKAVINAYSYNSEIISEASVMNDSISREYNYARPETFGEVNVSDLFLGDSKTFINSSVLTTGISQVVKDFDKNISYFIIDTLQGRDKDGDIVLESCRAKVEVKGTDLTQEEVYAKFINGEHSSFTEIIREKTNDKVGIVNNQVQEDVDDVILF